MLPFIWMSATAMLKLWPITKVNNYNYMFLGEKMKWKNNTIFLVFFLEKEDLIFLLTFTV